MMGPSSVIRDHIRAALSAPVRCLSVRGRVMIELQRSRQRQADRGSVLLFPTFTFPEAGGAWAGREMAGGYTAGHRGLNVTLVC